MMTFRRGLVVLAACAVALIASIGNAVDAQSKSAAASNEWPTYGHDPGGKRFSPLTQLTPGNVGQLEVAWVYHMRPAPATPPPAPAPTPAPGRGRGRGSGFAVSETTPIVIDGVMYISSPYGKVVALDSSTGKELWAYQVPSGVPSTRGVEYWAGDNKTPAQIVFGTRRWPADLSSCPDRRAE